MHDSAERLEWLLQVNKPVREASREHAPNSFNNHDGKQRPIIKEMVDQSQLMVVGAIYDASTGSVTFME